jgi:PD-(D/E)XK endonuclease
MYGNPPPTPEQQKRICDLYASGLRLKDVANEVGFCISTVKKFMALNGCESRVRGRIRGTGPVRQFADAGLVEFKAAWDKLESTVKGSISENHVKTRLSELGFDVWEPFCQNHRTDLIVFSGQRIVRIQVKSATYDIKIKSFRANVTRRRRSMERVGYYEMEDVDFFIIYCGGLDVLQFYVIPAKEAAGKSDLKLYPHRQKESIKEGPDWGKYRNAFSLLGLP